MALDRAPRDAALALGARADRIAYAFAGGYGAALDALLPDRDRARTAALCATEAGGVHPRAIQTELRDGRVHGDKTFVTLADHADDLLVLAKVGDDDAGRPRLVLARVDAKSDGVALEPLPEMPFVPEIGHASVRFDGAAATLLPGDGWDDYVRPFRTVEDIHVHLAFLGWLIASGRRWGAFGDATLEEALAIAAGLHGLAVADPREPATHLALAGAITASARLVEGLDLDGVPADDRVRWERDRRLLKVAGKAREARRVGAWTRLRR
ncbi:MAG: acyl-CoA dehydrogenase [Sandaracinaceae bacterium]|nr:acyl-CoA dehydrogenase [Sandaracinaceae bacterium]